MAKQQQAAVNEGTDEANTKAAASVNKLAAVREIVGKHGKNIKPSEIVKIMKSDFGADMTPGMASNYKGTVLRARSPRKPGRPAGVARKATAADHTGGISLEDIEAVKTLVNRIGAEKVHKLALVLAK